MMDKVTYSSSIRGIDTARELLDWLETIPPTAIVRYLMLGDIYTATWVEEKENDNA